MKSSKTVVGLVEEGNLQVSGVRYDNMVSLVSYGWWLVGDLRFEAIGDVTHVSAVRRST